MYTDGGMNVRWKVIYYVSPSGTIPVKEFLDAAGPALKAKVFRIFQHLVEYGLQTIIPQVKKLSGTPLWEIRILGGDSARVLFVTQQGQTILLLHAFYKKKQKTPQKELTTAMARLREYERGAT